MAPISPRVAVSALFALDGAALGGWVAHIPDAQSALRLTKGGLGFVLLASSLGAVGAIVPFSGRMIGRFGSRKVSLSAAVLVLAVIPLLLRAPTPETLALVLLMMGAANGTLDVAMNANSVAVQSRLERPILSSVHGWFCVGGFLGGAGASVASRRGIAPADYLVLASLVLAVLLAALAPGLLPEDRKEKEAGARFVFPRGRLLTLGLLCLVAFFAEGALWDWSAVYFRDVLRTTAPVAALGFGVGAGAMAVGRMAGDGFVARLGPSRVLAFSGALAGGGVLLSISAPHPLVAFLGFALAGLGLANAVPLLFAAAARMPGVSPGAGLATVTSLGYAAFLGGPPLVGNLAQATSLRVGLAVVGLLVLSVALWGPRAVEGQA